MGSCTVPADYYENINRAVKNAIEDCANKKQIDISELNKVGYFREDSSLYVASRALIEKLAIEKNVKEMNNWSEWQEFVVAQRRFAKEYDLIQVDW